MDDNSLIEQLILMGALECAGLDSNGEMLYAFTPKIKDVMPELYKEHMNKVNLEIMELWQKGYVEMNLAEENPIVWITPKALDENELAQLSDSQRWSLEELKRLTKRPKL